jgi:hypothetical protein
MPICCAAQAGRQGPIFQKQTADAEANKLAVGASTPYSVILMQRGMWPSQDAEVQAQALYLPARVRLDRPTGSTLDDDNIQTNEAQAGRLIRRSDSLPCPAGPSENPRQMIENRPKTGSRFISDTWCKYTGKSMPAVPARSGPFR